METHIITHPSGVSATVSALGATLRTLCIPGRDGESGNILVGDGYGSSFIHEYTKDGAYVRTIIGPGNGAGQVSPGNHSQGVCPAGYCVTLE